MSKCTMGMDTRATLSLPIFLAVEIRHIPVLCVCCIDIILGIGADEAGRSRIGQINAHRQQILLVGGKGDQRRSYHQAFGNRNDVRQRSYEARTRKTVRHREKRTDELE
jgi:hypothetical protein